MRSTDTLRPQTTGYKRFALVALVYAISFLVATGVDLPLSLALYNAGNTPSILMEVFGWYPAIFPAVLLALLWCIQPHHTWLGLVRRVLCGVLGAGSLVFLNRVSLQYLSRRGMLLDGYDPVFWLWILTLAVAAASLLLVVIRFSEASRIKLTFFSTVGCFYLVCGLVVVELFKQIWGRPRFDDMLTSGALSQFRPWYLPGTALDNSFPSSHVAYAMGIFLLLMLCDLYPSWKRNKCLVFGFCCAFIAAMCLSRVVIGRNFLSDTLAASLLMALLLFAILHSPLYRKALQKTLQKAENYSSATEQ